MEQFKKSNKCRSILLTIIDQELKSNHSKSYFIQKESTLIESFRVEFEESFNCASNINLIGSETNNTISTDNQETQSVTSSYITPSEGSVKFHKATSMEFKQIAKEGKSMLRSICTSLKSKHPIQPKKITRRSVALKTDKVNTKMMSQFKETIIQQTEIRKRRKWNENSNKTPKQVSDSFNFNTNQIEGTILQF